MAGPWDLTGQNIENTYQRVLQTPDGINFYDGTGSTVNLTATATAGGSNTNIQFNSASVFSGSNNFSFNYTTNNVILTGSLLVTQSHISTVDYIDFTTIDGYPHNEGRLHWENDTKTLQIDTDKNGFSIEVGHQNVVRVYNDTGADIPLGKVVRISGSQGNQPTIVTSSWNDDQSSAATLGFTATLIAGSGGNRHGYVVTNGLLRNVNTVAYPVGTQLYLSSSGNFTSTPPDAPLHEVRLGKVIVQNATTGIIYVDVMNGYELTELHDVKTTAYSNGDLLIQSGSLWINSKTLTGSYLLSGSLTTNDGVSVVSLTASFVSASSITGSLFGTSSWSRQALTASFVTGSNVFGPFGSNSVTSASYTLTSSFALTSPAGGTNAQIQFNSASRFAGTDGLTYNYTSSSLQQGKDVVASGIHSHAQGKATLAIGEYSHAEGIATQAAETGSHAEGIYTTASGNYSHAEGSTTQAIGIASHAEGSYTTSSGFYSHAEGSGSQAIGEASHAEGFKTITGYKAYYSNDIGITAPGDIYLESKYSDVFNQFTIGGFIILDDSFSGNVYGVIKLQISNVSFDGTNTIITLDNSSISTPEAKIAPFGNPVASKTDQTIGLYSHAEGDNTQTIGDYSHAEGRDTQTLGLWSHAEGSGSQAIGNYSHAEGYNTQVKGQYSHVEGYGSGADGNYSHAEGYLANAVGNYSHAEGYSTEATGLYSHAEGYGSRALGLYSHAEGETTQAVGTGSHAEGELSQATGKWSHAEGWNTTAEGDYSHAEGRFSQTIGEYSHAEGWNTIASGAYQHVQGQWNIESSTQSAFIIGNGNSSATRSNLVFAAGSEFQITGSLIVSGNNIFRGDQIISGSFTVFTGSVVEFQVTDTGVRIGNQITDIHNITGSLRVSGSITGSLFGTSSWATQAITASFALTSPAGGTDTQIQFNSASRFAGISSFTFNYASQSLQQGSNVTASGQHSHAEGVNTQAIGTGSHAEGRDNHAVGIGSHVEGRRNSASGDYSHAEGYNTIASGSFQHVQGQFNIASSAQSAFIIGNGIDDTTRSNLVFASGSQFQITGSLLVSGSIIGTSSWATKATSADNSRTPSTTVLSAFGSTIKAEPLWGGFTNYIAGNLTLITQRLLMCPVYVHESTTINGVKWIQTTAGNYTGNNYNGVGLYTLLNGTLTNVASSSNNANLWSTFASNTMGSASFGSAYNAAAGLYFIGTLWNSSATTTSPVIGLGPNGSTFTFDFTNSSKGFSFIANQTGSAAGSAMVTTIAMSTLTAAAQNPYLVLF